MSVPESHRRLCKLLFGLWQVALETSQYEEAAAIYDGLRALRPDLPQLEVMAGMMKLHAGEYGEAVQALQHVNTEGAHQLLATCHVMAGESDWRMHARDLADSVGDTELRTTLVEAMGVEGDDLARPAADEGQVPAAACASDPASRPAAALNGGR